MNKLKNIILILLIALIPFANVEAKEKGKQGKQKKASQTKKTTTKKVSSSKPSTAKKGTAKKETTTSKKAETRSDEDAAVAPSKDTSKPNEVVLYSSFKPTLRNAAKINFTAATPVLDTTKLSLTYRIPAQNLFFSYQPVPIKPLALFVDTARRWENHQYVKAGFGNYSTPYLEAGAAFGDGIKSSTSVHAKYTSSKGKKEHQQFSKAGIEAMGTYASGTNHEFSGKVFYDNSTQYQYGYEPSTLIFSKEQLKQQFNTVGMSIGLKNKQATDFGITYNPKIAVSYFFDARDGKELDFVAKLPVNKAFGTMFAFDVALTADITNYQRPVQTIKNNLFYLEPTIQFKTPNVKINAGIVTGWDNQVNAILPNVSAEAKINGEKFVLQAGWIGYYHKNSYQSLSAYNPYIAQPTALINTKVNEQYAGFKGSAGSHFTYNAKVSFLKMNGQPLFVNDNVDGKSFLIVNEPDLQAVRIHGEVGYTVQEKFSFLAGANITQFTKVSSFDKAFGLPPVEITGALRWKVLKDLHFKSDVFFWDGASYLSKTAQTQKLNAVMDLNAGLEYSLMPKLNLWLQFNNLLNTKYQRWNQYEVLGLNVIGGVVYSFK
jgi:hypothetical protein